MALLSTIAAVGAAVSGIGSILGVTSAGKGGGAALPPVGLDLQSVLLGLGQAAPELEDLQRRDLQTRLDLFREFAGPTLDEFGRLRTQQVGADIERVAQFAPRLRAAVAEPVGEDLRLELARQIRQDLGLGGQLDPSVRREVQQGVRAGQVARGTVFGARPIAQEALFTGSAAQNLLQSRRAAAEQFLRTNASIQIDPFQAIQQAASGVGPAVGFTQQAGLGQQTLGGLLGIQSGRTEQQARIDFGAGQISGQRPAALFQAAGEFAPALGGLISAFSTPKKSAPTFAGTNTFAGSQKFPTNISGLLSGAASFGF